MTINTIEIKKDFFNFNHPKIYTILGFILAIISFLVLYINNEFLKYDILNSIFYPLAFTSLLVFLIASLILKFSKQDIKIIKTGTIKTTTLEFIINNSHHIPFENITSLELNCDDFKGEFNYHNSDFEANYSLGTDNFIIIKTDKENFKKRVQLDSEREINLKK